MPDEPRIWQHSRLVDEAEVKKSGCFTTLPVRVSLYDDVADNTAKHGNRVWHWFVGDGLDTATSETSSPVGNLCSFFYPECAPGRVEVMAHIHELLFIQRDILDDGGCKDEDSTAAKDKKSPSGATGATRIEQRLSIYFLRAVQIDHSAGTDILETYKRSWRPDADAQCPSGIDDFNNLFLMRRSKARFNLYYFLLAFSQEFRLSALDWATMNDLLHLFELIMLHTGDLHAWEKDKQSGSGWARALNFIPFYMRTEKLTEDQAMEKMRRTILDYEKRFITAREQLYNRGSLSFHLRRWAEVCGAAIAGYHYWCANCPRFNRIDGRFDASDSQSAVVETPSSNETESLVQGETVLPYLHARPNADSEPADNPPRNGNLLDDSALQGPVNYIQSLSSKKTLTKLMEAFNIWLHIPEEQLSILSQVVEDLHNASLILDDIQDESELRRGNAATHLIYGAPQSINSATYMITRVSQLLHTSQNASLPIYFEELENLFIGQSWDLHWKFHKKCPSENEYFEMVDRKTGALFLMLLRLMQASSPISTSFDITHFCQLMGRWYQVRDDYMNLQSADYSNLKGFCEDLDEGKFSYPVIRCCNTNDSARDIILGAFQTHRGTSEKLARATKLQILRLIDSTGALDHTWKMVRDLHREIDAEIDVLEKKLGENQMLRAMIKALGKVPAPDVS